MEAKRNKTFTILSCVGIVLIVLGHLNYNILEFGGLFPYYSYHVLIFVFTAGYFYKPEDEDNIMAFLRRKAKRLLLPYFIYNLLIGILVTILHRFGFTYGEDISFYNLFIAPFVGGHQFMLNAPAWFIPALFLLEVCNVIGRKILSLIKIRNEYVLMALYMILGITTVILAKRGSVYDWYKIPGRLLFMAPVLQSGRLYREKLEKMDKIPDIIHFCILLILNLILVYTQGGLAFSVVWVTGFVNNPLVPYVTTFTGIALWLRISKILARIPGNFAFTEYMGRHTYEICTLHLLGWMLLGSFMYSLYNCFGICSDLDMGMFLGDVYYAYTPMGVDMFKWIYLAVGILFPLGLCYLGDRIKKRLCGLQTDGKITK